MASYWALASLLPGISTSEPVAQIPWHALRAQFGSGFGHGELRRSELTEEQQREHEAQTLRDFRKQFLKRLKEVLLFYPNARDAIKSDTDCLTLRRCPLMIPQTKGFKVSEQSASGSK